MQDSEILGNVGVFVPWSIVSLKGSFRKERTWEIG